MSSIASPRNKELVRSAPGRNIAKRCQSENIPSRIILPPIQNSVINRDYNISSSSNSEMKSKYCPSELQKQGAGRRHNRNDSAPATKQDTDSASGVVAQLRQKDVSFLRKMLAMNKKQEMMLNKRLAKLMEEEELQKAAAEEGKEKHLAAQLPSTARVIRAEHQVSAGPTNEHDVHLSKPIGGIPLRESKLIAHKTTSKPGADIQCDLTSRIAQPRKIQYDINGRRIYYYSDVEKESVDDESEQKQESQSTLDLKRTENSYKINKKGSASSRKTFTMKKSLTYITTPSRAPKTPSKSKRKVRKENGDSSSYSNSENPLGVHLRPAKAGCKGDGGDVENVVVHCSTVYRKHPNPTNNLRVWNFGSLHSLKHDSFLGENKTVSSEQRFRKMCDLQKPAQTRPVSIRNNNFQIQFKSSPTRNDKRDSDTVETMFLVREKFSDIGK